MTSRLVLRRGIACVATAAAALALLAGTGLPAGAALAGPLPSSMASVGDSITRAYNVDGSHAWRDNVQFSWSTGPDTAVKSHYQRILAADAAISGHVYNDAATGAKMSALDNQLMSAARQNVEYVTVLIGANDLCSVSISTMTPTVTFKSQFQQAMANFTQANAKARVFVSSIVNIYDLWAVLHTNTSATSTWQSLQICQSMLSPYNTEADRQAVVTREQEYNKALADVCAQYRQCRWDGGATYNVHFSASDVSTVDYFHPSLAGQNTLASVTWQASYWPSM